MQTRKSSTPPAAPLLIQGILTLLALIMFVLTVIFQSKILFNGGELFSAAFLAEFPRFLPLMAALPPLVCVPVLTGIGANIARGKASGKRIMAIACLISQLLLTAVLVWYLVLLVTVFFQTFNSKEQVDFIQVRYFAVIGLLCICCEVFLLIWHFSSSRTLLLSLYGEDMETKRYGHVDRAPTRQLLIALALTGLSAVFLLLPLINPAFYLSELPFVRVLQLLLLLCAAATLAARLMVLKFFRRYNRERAE